MEPRRIELPEAAKRCWPKAVELVGDLMSECATLEDDDWHLGGGTALAADWKRATRQTVLEGNVSVMVDNSVNIVSSAVFMRSGRFEFKGLPPGPALLIVHARGFAPAYTTLTLAAGESERVDVGLLLDGTVLGTVVGSDGNAQSGATIHAMYRGFAGAALVSSFIGGHLVSDADGRFRVNGIVPNEAFSIPERTRRRDQ